MFYCFVNVFVATGLATPFVMAMALTVVVSDNVIVLGGVGLNSVGGVPSVV